MGSLLRLYLSAKRKSVFTSHPSSFLATVCTRGKRRRTPLWDVTCLTIFTGPSDLHRLLEHPPSPFHFWMISVGRKPGRVVPNPSSCRRRSVHLRSGLPRTHSGLLHYLVVHGHRSCSQTRQVLNKRLCPYSWIVLQPMSFSESIGISHNQIILCSRCVVVSFSSIHDTSLSHYRCLRLMRGIRNAVNPR